MAAALSFSPILTAKPPSPLKLLRRPSFPSSLSMRHNPPLLRFSAQDNNGGAAETLAETKEEDAEKEEEKLEIREMMAARKEERSKGDELFGGVAEEVREIEWPEFWKVIGTTGVVLAVIAGSSLALLTVNAILAELSDRVFAGKGVQDFFSG